MNAPPGYRETALYGEFVVGRSSKVRLQATTGSAFLDLSAAKWELHLRFSAYPVVKPTTFDRDYVMGKVLGKTVNGDTAIAEVDVVLPTARDQLHVEWVAVETDVAAPAGVTTPTGKKEHALDLPWIARAILAPGP